jgi:hypothetical protein
MQFVEFPPGLDGFCPWLGGGVGPAVCRRLARTACFSIMYELAQAGVAERPDQAK